MEYNFAFIGGSKMLSKKSAGKHLQYLELDQDTKFKLRKVKDILDPANDEIMDNWYALIPEESELNSHSCDEIEINQIRSYG